MSFALSKKERVVALCTAAAVVSSAALYVYFSRVKSTSSVQDNNKSSITRLPGPTPSDDKLGNFPDMGKAGSLHEYLGELTAEYGPIGSFWWGDTRVAYVSSPHASHQIVQKKMDSRPPLLFMGFHPLIGDHSIQYANGDEFWQRYHKVWMKAYGGASLSTHLPVLTDSLSTTLRRWMSDAHKNNGSVELDITKEMFDLSARCIIRISFSTDISDQLSGQIARGYFECWDEMESRLVLGKTATAERETAFQSSLNDMKSAVQHIVDQSDKQSDSSLKSSFDHRSFLDLLNNNPTLYPTIEHIQNEAITAIAGGTHTTGNAMAWALYHLASNQECQSAALKEITTVFPKLDLKHVSVKQLNNLHYCRSVIDETLRLDAIGPWAARFHPSDNVYLSSNDGKRYEIPKNMPVIISMGVQLQSSDIWGDDVNEFKPDRWTAELSTAQKRGFKPFGGAGGRKCPGHKLFYAEAYLFLAGILTNFKLDLVDSSDKTDVKRVYGLVTQMGRPVHVRATLRQ